jgi:hypothetical protein
MNLLSQISDPNFTHGVAWLVGMCSVILTLGGSAVIVQKFVINGRLLRREDVPQQVQVQNETQKRQMEILPTLVTKTMCDERHNVLAMGNENLIRLRGMEQIAAYESSAKQSRKVLHDQIAELNKSVERVATRLDGLEEWMRSTSVELADVSKGLANLSGSQGKG